MPFKRNKTESIHLRTITFRHGAFNLEFSSKTGQLISNNVRIRRGFDFKVGLKRKTFKRKSKILQLCMFCAWQWLMSWRYLRRVCAFMVRLFTLPILKRNGINTKHWRVFSYLTGLESCTCRTSAGSECLSSGVESTFKWSNAKADQNLVPFLFTQFHILESMCIQQCCVDTVQ